MNVCNVVSHNTSSLLPASPSLISTQSDRCLHDTLKEVGTQPEATEFMKGLIRRRDSASAYRTASQLLSVRVHRLLYITHWSMHMRPILGSCCPRVHLAAPWGQRISTSALFLNTCSHMPPVPEIP